MKNDYQLLKKISENPGGISLTKFKKDYRPLNLVDKIRGLLNSGLIEIDWGKGIVYPVDENLIHDFNKIKVELTKKYIVLPKYMQTDKIEVNKPFINIKREGEN